MPDRTVHKIDPIHLVQKLKKKKKILKVTGREKRKQGIGKYRRKKILKYAINFQKIIEFYWYQITQNF